LRYWRTLAACVVAICLLGATAFLVVSVVIEHAEISRDEHLATHGVMTQATVRSVDFTPCTADNCDLPGETSARLEYRTMDQATQQASAWYVGTPDASVGQTVVIVYDETEPSVVQFADHRNPFGYESQAWPFHSWWGPATMFGLFAIALGGTLIALRAERRSTQRRGPN
jgi:hypothetical protein